MTAAAWVGAALVLLALGVRRGPRVKAQGVRDGAPRIEKATVRRVDRYDDLFTEAAHDYGVPRSWLQGLCAAESDGDPRSGAGTSGYKGLLQADKGDEQLDPETSIRAGAEKLRAYRTKLRKQLTPLGIRLDDLAPDLQLGLLACAFNAGPGVVVRALSTAHAAGDEGAWRDEAYYVPALVYFGSYNPRVAARGRRSAEEIAEAEDWRTHRLLHQELPLDKVRAQAPPLLTEALEQRFEATASYVAKIQRYARFFAERDAGVA